MKDKRFDALTKDVCEHLKEFAEPEIKIVSVERVDDVIKAKISIPEIISKQLTIDKKD